jgi:hypothetical protein
MSSLKKLLCSDVKKIEIPKKKRMYLFLFIFVILILFQLFFHSLETNLILTHGSLFINSKPIVVIHAEEKYENDINKLLNNLHKYDPTRKIHLYVDKKGDWWKIYENLLNIEVLDIKQTKIKIIDEFKILIFPLLLNTLLENDNAMFTKKILNSQVLFIRNLTLLNLSIYWMV